MSLLLVLLMARKAGIDGALDFTKLVITLDSALIAFLAGASFLRDLSGGTEKGLVVGALIALAVSLIAGLLVCMEAASMLSRGSHDLNAPVLRYPGIANVVLFALGAIMVAGIAGYELIIKDHPRKPTVQTLTVRCDLGPNSRSLLCRGAAQAPAP